MVDRSSANVHPALVMMQAAQQTKQQILMQQLQL